MGRSIAGLIPFVTVGDSMTTNFTIEAPGIAFLFLFLFLFFILFLVHEY
jgi:hypothetical protein